MKKKIGRNDPCPCGSKKKFKKCCEKKMLGKKFLATKTITPGSSGLTQFFQTRTESLKPLTTRTITTMPPVQATPPPKTPKPDPQSDSQDPNSQKES